MAKKLIPILALLLLLLLGVIFLVNRYMPTMKHMPLSDYYKLAGEDEAAVVLDGTYEKPKEDPSPYAIMKGGKVYLSLTFLKDRIDKGYVWDPVEGILRYTTDSQLVQVSLGSQDYLIDKTSKTMDDEIILTKGDRVYLLLDWVKSFTDLKYSYHKSPARVMIETAGWKHEESSLRKDTAVRRNGGVKSLVLEDGKKKEKVVVLKNYGKWSLVLTDRCVLGCVRNSALTEKKEVTTKRSLPERKHSHIRHDGKVVMAWQQVTNKNANVYLEPQLAETDGLNVVSPTWLALSDNEGNLSDLTDPVYISTCHQRGIEVWALVSNFQHKDIDTTSVLNQTSKRDRLVNGLISSALMNDLDGINVDFEGLSKDAADGYLQFIRELSLKCQNNNLVLSVDNYPPLSSNLFYGRDVQADYADYVIVMAYDEHYAGSKEAGSVSSIGFVRDAVKNTRKEVPADQLILGMPLYTRLWSTDTSSGTLTTKSLSMTAAASYIEDHGIRMTWQDEVGQNYGEYTEGSTRYQIWNEDAQSLALKLGVMQDEDLAGGAFWKLGFEPQSIWNVAAQYMKD